MCETYIHWLPLEHSNSTPTTGGLALNPGMCPGQESNRLPFGPLILISQGENQFCLKEKWKANPLDLKGLFIY